MVTDPGSVEEGDTTQTAPPSHRRLILILSLAAGVIALAILAIAAFPVSFLRETAERELSARLDAPVKIGSLSRTQLLSFTPEIVAGDVQIGQPAWAGKGDFLKVERASARVSIFSLISGDPDIRSLHISGLDVALVRDEEGKSNWDGFGGKQDDGGGRPLQLDQLTVDRSRFSLNDAKRKLELTGSIRADASSGLIVNATGKFDGAPATLAVTGGGAQEKPTASGWPFTANLSAAPFDLRASGTMAGPLNLSDMQLTMRAKGSSLKQLDYIIEAGLFGTQDIDLTGDIRHEGKDWFIDRVEGTIGRSTLRGKATVLKRDGRTKIDAEIDAPQFDFDDLADDAGLAAARAKEARIGKRVIPDTRINLSKMGPTDGRIRFSAHRLLIKGGSAFRSLKGDIVLDHRVLRLENVVAGLESGRITGWVEVDSTADVPVFKTELRVAGTSLDTLIGQPDMISGPLQGLVRIEGRGDTIRQAFERGNGKIAFVASRGSMNRAAAFVLGQNLGGAIRQEIRNDEAMTPLRCAILAFSVKGGILTPAPLTIDTEVSRGAGRGQINLRGETIALTMNGAAKGNAPLKLVDPIRVRGTLSNPSITFNDPGERSGEPNIVRAIGRSIGSALGLRKDKDGNSAAPPSAPADCAALSRAALR